MHDKQGSIETARDVDANGNAVRVNVPRADPNLVPCNTESGCPKGHYDQPHELSDAMQQAYQHYLECRAVGRFPDDPLVRKCAAVVRQAEDDCDRIEQLQQMHTIAMGGQLSAMRGMFGG